jgi:hypothetical protein
VFLVAGQLSQRICFWRAENKTNLPNESVESENQVAVNLGGARVILVLIGCGIKKLRSNYNFFHFITLAILT